MIGCRLEHCEIEAGITNGVGGRCAALQVLFHDNDYAELL